MSQENANNDQTVSSPAQTGSEQVAYASPGTKSALRGRRFLTPGFLAAVVVLGVAAVGLNATTQFMKLHFKKQAVDIAKPV